MFLGLFSLVTFLYTGWAAAGIATRGLSGGPASRTLTGLLGLGLALGLLSVTQFLVLCAGVQSSGGLLTAGLGVAGAAAALSRRSARATAIVATTGSDALAGPWWSDAALVAVAVCFSFAGASVVAARLLLHPHGLWDAWAGWNMRARFLVAGPVAMRALYAPDFGVPHSDYPLLVPGLASFGQAALGHLTPAVPAVIAAVFTTATVMVVGLGVAVTRGWRFALLSVIALLGTVPLLREGASQYADVPLAFYAAGCGVLLAVPAPTDASRRACLVLAGAFAGLAAWTKNEGMLFLVAALCAAVVRTPGNWRARGRAALMLLGGATPFLVVVAYFKLALATPNDIVSSQSSLETMHRLVNLSRYRAIIGGVFDFGAQFPVIALAAFVILAGVTRARVVAPAARALATLLAVMAAGYAAAYLVTPLDIGMHIQQSMGRLMVQVWPLAVLLAILMAGKTAPLPGPARDPQAWSGGARDPGMNATREDQGIL